MSRSPLPRDPPLSFRSVTPPDIPLGRPAGTPQPPPRLRSSGAPPPWSSHSYLPLPQSEPPQPYPLPFPPCPHWPWRCGEHPSTMPFPAPTRHASTAHAWCAASDPGDPRFLCGSQSAPSYRIPDSTLDSTCLLSPVFTCSVPSTRQRLRQCLRRGGAHRDKEQDGVESPEPFTFHVPAFQS